MGGGLFGTPLYLNVKCLVVSAAILGVYWLPHPKAFTRRAVVAFLLVIVTYISLSWYDVFYECNDNLNQILPLKPPTYKKGYEELPVGDQKTFHILIATGGRPTLKDMLDSLKCELESGDALSHYLCSSDVAVEGMYWLV